MEDKAAVIRLNKYLSLAGVTSRRGAATLIAEQRVTINDEPADAPGLIVDTDNDTVKVDGVAVEPVATQVYVLLNKPKKVMTTLHDPFRRRTVLHYLRKLRYRVYPVGRLDFDTSGLLLLTNDGDLAFRLAHPRYEVAKVYEVRVNGHFKPESAEQIANGLTLEDGAVGRAEVTILGFVGRCTRLRMVLTEGRKREVRQLCELVGHAVEDLVRVEYAGLTLKGLQSGSWRYLSASELERLRSMVGLPPVENARTKD